MHALVKWTLCSRHQIKGQDGDFFATRIGPASKLDESVPINEQWLPEEGQPQPLNTLFVWSWPYSSMALVYIAPEAADYQTSSL
jgi:hypothetical protein